eukprot:Skav202663  [mRNA]  locus=scaffold1791:250698:255681:+ [translate_table: standard]
MIKLYEPQWSPEQFQQLSTLHLPLSTTLVHQGLSDSGNHQPPADSRILEVPVAIEFPLLSRSRQLPQLLSNAILALQSRPLHRCVMSRLFVMHVQAGVLAKRTAMGSLSIGCREPPDSCRSQQRYPLGGRSKGLAYVEFYLQEATLKALALSGQPIKGQARCCADGSDAWDWLIHGGSGWIDGNRAVRVQPSQAEKNRAAQAAKASIHYTAPRETPLRRLGAACRGRWGMGSMGQRRRLYVGGLTDSLANISEEELKKLFSPFGPWAAVLLVAHQHVSSSDSPGFAFVQFKNASEAREAMTAMNGFQLAGRRGSSWELPRAAPLKEGMPCELVAQATSDMQLGEGGAPGANLAIGENLHEERPAGWGSQVAGGSGGATGAAATGGGLGWMVWGGCS